MEHAILACEDRVVVAILANIVANAVAIWVATLIVPGVTIGGGSAERTVLALAIVGALLGLVNAVIKPLIKVFTSCLYVITFGLMAFVVNAFMLRLVGWGAGTFGIDFSTGRFFWSTIGAAVVVTLVSMVLNRILVSTDQD